MKLSPISFVKSHLNHLIASVWHYITTISLVEVEAVPVTGKTPDIA